LDIGLNGKFYYFNTRTSFSKFHRIEGVKKWLHNILMAFLFTAKEDSDEEKQDFEQKEIQVESYFTNFLNYTDDDLFKFDSLHKFERFINQNYEHIKLGGFLPN
jgi:hypothetical protein